MTTDLAKRYPRTFVPHDADMGDWAQIEPLLASLLARDLDTQEALERWLDDRSELEAAIDEEGTRRYIAATQQTDDPEREQAYLAFIREIVPRLEPQRIALQRRYLASSARAALEQAYVRVFDRDTENDVALFREENIPLHVREAELAQRYHKITGGMTVIYRGEERTLPLVLKLLEEPDRAVREEAWTLVARRRLADRDALEDLFDEMVTLRQQIARNAGFADYRAYTFRARRRFEYTPDDCVRYHDAIARHVVPLIVRLNAERRRTMGAKSLRPWDLVVDPEGRPPLRPFETGHEFVERSLAAFTGVDPDLGAQFAFMGREGLLDLESRKGKALVGYQSTLAERRVPFIFMNAVGRDTDVRTLLHEGGHAFHALAAREHRLIDYRHSPTEFAEVASMGMEVLSLPHMAAFYPEPHDARRAARQFFEGRVRLLGWIAVIDAFQHWIYTHEGHSRDERAQAWTAILRRFQPGVDWTGHEDAEAYAWHAQPHPFAYPFYYIEYGIAQLGALQLWMASRRDYADAVRRYRAALALGGSRPLPELFKAAGLRFEMGDAVVAPVAEAIGQELASLT